MKNFSVALNAVLVLAVAFLYYKTFSGVKVSKGSDAGTALSGIYYINIDTLNEKLDFLTVRQEELEKKEIDADVSLKQKGAELEREIMAYQSQAQQGLLTPKQMQSVEQRLAKRQQSLMMERDSITSSLLKESQEINKILSEKLKKQIGIFSEANNCQLVLGYTEGSNVLFADESMNITKQILEKMNSDKE
jgi:outer membrane protein